MAAPGTLDHTRRSEIVNIFLPIIFTLSKPVDIMKTNIFKVRDSAVMIPFAELYVH